MEYYASYSLTDLKPALKSPQILPPDVNPESAEEIMEWYRPWRRRIYISAPIVFFSHLTPLIIMLILCITFGVVSFKGNTEKKDKHKFYGVLPEALTALVSLVIFTYIERTIVPAFWRRHARQLVEAGTFDSTMRNGGFGNSTSSGMTVLELGCGDGKASAILARTILERQRDIEKMHLPGAALPTFIGYDSWNKYTRLPNMPRAYLYNLVKAGVPRYHVIANRVDTVHHIDAETQLPILPYASESVTLIISSLGLSELGGFKQGEKKRRAWFHECCRVLEPGGRMVLFESEGIRVDDGIKFKWRDIFRGTMETYRRTLVNVHKWPEENVKTSWGCGIHHMIAIKPAGVPSGHRY
ncbi:hypothetical protein CPB86DRAFT_779105 [Serendipita vermifera]|nr:hypothetical protein CPB86DRAFT_779105 [Serendipita vermifera]